MWLLDQLADLVRLIGQIIRAFFDAVIEVLVWLRDWFIAFVDYVYTMLMSWFWSLAQTLGVSDFFESLDGMAQIAGPYLEFAVWAIPIVPVATIITSAWILAWVITGVRHGVGVISINAG